MKKIFTLTLLVLILFLAACQTNPLDQTPAEEAPLVAEVEGIPLIVELRTSSTWSDLKILNSELILAAEVVSLIGEPSFFDLEGNTLAVEQSQEAAANGEQVGLIASFILNEDTADVVLEFDLTKDCSNQATVSIYGVVEDQPRMIYQRDLDVTEDCGGVAFSMDLDGSLAALEKMGATNYAKGEVVFIDTDPPTIQNGIEVELLTRTDGAWLVDPELPNYEILAVVGEPTHFGHGGDLIIDLGQPVPEAELGKWMGGRIRLEVDPDDEDRILDFTLHHGCLNETILNFFKVVEGERFPIPNLDHTYSTTIFECADPLPVQIDLDQNLVNLRYFVLENINLDEGDLDAEGQIFLEAELMTNADWAEILSDDERIVSSELLSISGDPRSASARMDLLRIAQPSSAAGSGLEVGITASYGFIPSGEGNQIPLKLSSGCLNQTTLQMFANVNNKRIPIPLEGGRESLTIYGCLGWDFILDLDAVQAIIKAAELYDDLPLVAHLSDIKGDVQVRQPGMKEFYPAREGSLLNVGGEVLTGANSEVYLSISDGAVIRLGPNTIFGLEMGINSEEIVMPRFRLELGEMEVVSGSDGFLIITPNEVLGAIGSAARITVSAEGVAEMDCISGDCFQYDGTADTESVKESLPAAVVAALDIAKGQLIQTETTGIATDTDGDGVPNEIDLCLEDGDRGYGLDSQGCPIDNPSEDNDGDGFINGEDYCPNLAADVSGKDRFGCPDSTDTDGDGIEDYRDICRTSGDIGFGVSETGCPLTEDDWPDPDQDGFSNYVDFCPDVWAPAWKGEYIEGVYSPHDNHGCPFGDNDWDGIPDLEMELADPDGDGFPNYQDKCPFDPGLYYDYFSFGIFQGCPIGDFNFDGIPDDWCCGDCYPLDLGEFEECCGDSDQDAICDFFDDCPYSPGSLINQGCKEGDSDGDGVRDGADLCPGAVVDPIRGVTPLGCPRVIAVRMDAKNTEEITASSPVTGDEITVHGPAPQLAQVADKDSDGYVDAIDQCPGKGDQGYGLGLDGCPLLPPLVDSDEDGFADDHDQCPAEGDQGYGLGQDGCPLPAPVDSDGDGIYDAEDACPELGDQGAGLRGNGCPVSEKATADSDGDGIVGSLDKCPEQGGDVGLNGCPKTAADSDGDGVPDTRDKCPDAGSSRYGLSRDGCPLTPPDTDGDGVSDNVDSCPNQGDKGYGITADGCPAGAPDSDGDGVTDDVDGCPDKGDQGFGVNSKGCPLPDPTAPTPIPPTPVPATDSDGDGINDSVDRCPNEGDAGYGINARGCPNPPPEPTTAPVEPTEAPPEPTADPT